jgi:uncharacterized protein YqeY
MSLLDQIKSDLPTALKAGDTLRTSVLRMLLSEINYKWIDLQRELTEADIVGVIAKEMKKRREAIDSFTAGGRSEQAASEGKELEILQKYLPAQMTEKEIEIEIEKIIKDNKIGDFGQMMKIVAPQFRGKADGSTVAQIVKKMIENK